MAAACCACSPPPLAPPFGPPPLAWSPSLPPALPPSPLLPPRPGRPPSPPPSFLAVPVTTWTTIVLPVVGGLLLLCLWYNCANRKRRLPLPLPHALPPPSRSEVPDMPAPSPKKTPLDYQPSFAFVPNVDAVNRASTMPQDYPASGVEAPLAG